MQVLSAANYFRFLTDLDLEKLTLNLETWLDQNGKNYFYIMHLSYNGKDRERLWNYAKKENLIGLDHPGRVYDDWEILRNKIVREKRLPPIWIKQFDRICREMKKGDVVVILEGWHHLLGIAEVDDDKHDYRKELSNKKNPNRFFDHVRKVKWIVGFEYGKRRELRPPVTGFRNALSKVEKGTKRWALLAKITW